MPRVMKRAADVSPEKASVLGPDTMIFSDEMVGDAEVLRIEQAPSNFEDLELEKRREADKVRHAAWQAVGSFGVGPRPATPFKGSVCARCGATDQVLGSPSASGPFFCAFGCS